MQKVKLDMLLLPREFARYVRPHDGLVIGDWCSSNDIAFKVNNLGLDIPPVKSNTVLFTATANGSPRFFGVRS